MFNQIPGHPLIQLGWHIKPHFSLHVARMHSEDWASVCVSQSEFLRKHLPSGALFPSIPHITLEQRTRPRMWMAQGHRLRVSGRTRTETLCPDFQPQLTHATPENLPFLSTVRRVAMFVCLLGHLRLDLRMSWCSAFNLFLLLPLAIKVLLISHSLIYISYLLFLRLTQCSQSGVLQSPPSPFSPLSQFFHLECPSLQAVAQHLCMFREHCFRLQEFFLEMPFFGEATKTVWVDPFRSWIMQTAQPYLLLVSTVLFHY